jgi:hypothetical protein
MLLGTSMRALSIFVAILVLMGLASARMFVSKLTRAEAIRVASQLRVGMSEEDAGKFVAKYGLTNAVTLGAATGWGRFYDLKDGSSLVLDYRARPRTTNHWWEGKGVLEKAFIQSNNVNIVSIKLIKVP